MGFRFGTRSPSHIDTWLSGNRSSFGTETLVTKLSWCHFEREGHYISGGRITVEPPLYFKLDIDWDMLESTKRSLCLRGLGLMQW